jgi:hypothetical protein
MIFIVAKIICAQKEITLQLSFNPWITVVMTLITFAVCSINLWSKIRKEMKYSIVENIREL